MQDDKVRVLLRSIGQLQAQIQALKEQDKEHRRSALIQGLRKQQQDQELVIDVLTQVLMEKAPEFGNSRAAVNELVAKRTAGEPPRVRSKTREELEEELRCVDRKYTSAMRKLRQERQGSGGCVPDRHAATAEDGGKEVDRRARQQERSEAVPQHEDDNDLSADLRQDLKLEEELARLRAEIVEKTAMVDSQAGEINKLHAELDQYRLIEEKAARKKLKIAQLREQLAALEAENLTRVREREAQAEQYLEMQEELQFLRDLKSEDVGARDEERLEALEQIQMLRSRELELQNQIEEQQKRSALDRSNTSQQIRVVEKEKQLLEDEKRLAVNTRIAAERKHANALRDVEVAQSALQDEKARSGGLAKRIEELEQMIVEQEEASVAQRESLKTSMAEQIHTLGLELERRAELHKSCERQLNAAKLLVRQTKKEKEQLESRLRRLQPQEARSAADTQGTNK